jgi:hypothetical protein
MTEASVRCARQGGKKAALKMFVNRFPCQSLEKNSSTKQKNKNDNKDRCNHGCCLESLAMKPSIILHQEGSC